MFSAVDVFNGFFFLSALGAYYTMAQFFYTSNLINSIYYRSGGVKKYWDRGFSLADYQLKHSP